jgi:hypothetical protein
MVTPDYAVNGWRKAFRIVDGEYLKMMQNVLEPGCAQTLETWDLSMFNSNLRTKCFNPFYIQMR